MPVESGVGHREVAAAGRPGPGRFDAVVLAGGAARRLGGVSKPEVLVAGVSLLDRVLAATVAARRVVVVGPRGLARPGVPTVLEDPPSGGPVAGIDAGLTFLDRWDGESAGPGGDGEADGEPPVLVLACDVPRVAAVVPGLLAALVDRPGLDGVRLVDADGHAQLVAVYRRRALAAALAGLRASGGVHGVSVRRMHERLRTGEHPDPHGHGRDADTWEDVADLETLIARSEDVADDGDLHRWVASACAELGVDPEGVDVDLLLALSKDVARDVARPAVPLTGFLVGYAAARAGGDRAALQRVVARATELATGWPARSERHTTGPDDAPAAEERTP